MYIRDHQGLTDLVERLRGTPRVALDTEFVREKTYWPQLEIIQLATPDIEAIIDYRALGTLAPFQELLLDPATLKILHAAQQDLEIFFNLLGEVPAPLFDTQVAAALLGLGAQVGYARLVEEMVGVKLQKLETRTDWSRRPLSESQVEYALDDVRYLLPMHESLTSRLTAMGRERWLDAEWESMAQSGSYQRTVPEEAWRRVKGMHRLKPRQLAVLQELAAWREREAMRRDRALPFVVRDEVLLDLARRAPTTVSELHNVRGLHVREIERQGEQILTAIQQGVNMPRDQRPTLAARRRPTSQENALVALMQTWLKARSDETDIAPSYLATAAELREFVMASESERRSHGLMRGWRAKMVGHDLLALLEGEAALAWEPDGGEVRLLRAEETERPT